MNAEEMDKMSIQYSNHLKAMVELVGQIVRSPMRAEVMEGISEHYDTKVAGQLFADFGVCLLAVADGMSKAIDGAVSRERSFDMMLESMSEEVERFVRDSAEGMIKDMIWKKDAEKE